VTADWVWDDPEIHSEQLFLRSVPRKPDFAVPNLVTRRLEVKPAALRFDPDGMSVSCSQTLANEGQDRANLCNWGTHTTVEFPAGAARETEEAGLVYDPVPDHPAGDAFGKAHSLVRASTPTPPRQTKRNIQAAIAAHCRWVDEDPQKPEA
jgi:hypothetical protein